MAEECDYDIKYVIAGGTQNRETALYYQSLLDKASGCGNRIIFTGPVEGEEKYELLRKCRIFAVPARDEGLPIALLEAMSYGCICVASDIQAHREVIQDARAGFLFPADDKAHFIRKMLVAMMQPEQELSQMSAGARKMVDGKYSWDHAADRYESIYKDLVNERERKQSEA